MKNGWHILQIGLFLAMPRGTVLTIEEKTKITTYKELGLSNRRIATRIGRSSTVVDNFIKLGVAYGSIKPKGPPKRITTRQKRQIISEARKNKLSAAQIKAKLTLPVTVRRVQQILHDTPTLVYTKRLKKPALTKVHKEARLNFSRNVMNWTDQWKDIIFSDEKKFNLDGPDGCQYYWHDLRDCKEVRMSRNFGGGSVMVWGAFGYLGKIPIMWVPRKMNSEIYRELLEFALDEYGEAAAGPNFTFQQDNAAVHTGKVVKKWFSEANIKLLDWPSRSPDLNPVENIWGIMCRRLYVNGRQYSSVPELKAAILKVWTEIEMETIRKTIDSMPQRIFDVIRNQGGYTKY